jgi:hypothetical protein
VLQEQLCGNAGCVLQEQLCGKTACVLQQRRAAQVQKRTCATFFIVLFGLPYSILMKLIRFSWKPISDFDC